MAKTENVTYFKQFERYKAVIWKVAEVQKTNKKATIHQTMQDKMDYMTDGL